MSECHGFPCVFSWNGRDSFGLALTTFFYIARVPVPSSVIFSGGMPVGERPDTVGGGRCIAEGFAVRSAC